MLENYYKDEAGVIHQINKKPFVYDQAYVAQRYPTYEDKCINMAHLRLGCIVGALGQPPKSLLEVGYGAGYFLDLCTNVVDRCYGHDISGWPIPTKATFVNTMMGSHYDVICFYDVLEHFDDITFIKQLDVNYIVISVPECHYVNDAWFEAWKHRRPDEHLHHFNKDALNNFFFKHGYYCEHMSNIEDIIRTPVDGRGNIITGIFSKL